MRLASFARGTIGARLTRRAHASTASLNLTPNVDAIELTFLGTSSGAPSMSRNQQALAVQMGGDTWLFDCGEATQHRIMQTALSPPSIRRIFISHMHGDHVFGLPGLLCNIAASHVPQDGVHEARVDGRARSSATHGTADDVIVIVGPPGLRAWLRATLGNAYATLGGMKLQVHELMGLRATSRGPVWLRPPVVVDRQLPYELAGQSLEPSSDGTWTVPLRNDEPPITVTALELDHTVPTVGWVLTEKPRPAQAGTLKLAILSDMRGLKDPSAGAAQSR